MKSLPLKEALQHCAEIGYAHVEFALNEGYPTTPAVFTPEAQLAATASLKQHRLRLPCLMLNLSLMADEKAHARALSLIADAGRIANALIPEQPAILETVLGGKPANWEQQKSEMADKLQAWADAATKAKTVIALKAHVASAVNCPERLLWLLEAVPSPSIQVTYDYSHFEIQGISMEESMTMLLPRTRFIHVKDSAGDAARFQFLLPGEGRTDYRRYFSELRKNNYTGPVCVEVSGQIFNKPGYDPILAAKKSFETLSSAMV
jgi:inosose dehydratase